MAPGLFRTGRPALSGYSMLAGLYLVLESIDRSLDPWVYVVLSRHTTRMVDYVSMDEVTWAYIVTLLAIIPWFCYGLSILFHIVSLIYGKFRLYKKTDAKLFVDELPGVSVVKPLMGVDPFLETNLTSHFTMNYPKFELLFCVQDDQDPAIDLVKKLCAQHPDVDCRLFIGGCDGILNPMVNNMVPAYEAAAYDIIWVSTSRIKASTDVLLDMVGKMQLTRVTMVHQMPYTTDQSIGLAAAVEKIYFGASAARYYLAFNALSMNCVTGMSYLIRKSDLDAVNGLAWFGRFLAEDFFISKYLHDRGFRHQVSAFPAQQNVSSSSIAAYKDRMVRWLRLRLNMMPFTAAFLEPMSESVPLGIYFAWSVHHFFGFCPYTVFCIHWCVWFIKDYVQLRLVQNGPLPFSKLTFLIAWLIRELLYVLIFLEAVISARRITWGKRTYRLSNFGGHIELVTDKSILPL